MKYFALEKTDTQSLLKNKIDLKKGYKFNKKVTITLYNSNLTKSILEMKLSASLNKLLKLYTSLDESDEDGVNNLIIKSETLKNILMQKYYPYLGKNRTKFYLIKLENFENTLAQKKNKKSKVR